MSLIERVYALSIPPVKVDETNNVDTLPLLVNRYLNLLFYVVGVLAFIYLIYAGILYITANGNDEQAKKGQKGIINAVIGIIIIALALTIIKVATNIGTNPTST